MQRVDFSLADMQAAAVRVADAAEAALAAEQAKLGGDWQATYSTRMKARAARAVADALAEISEE